MSISRAGPLVSVVSRVSRRTHLPVAWRAVQETEGDTAVLTVYPLQLCGMGCWGGDPTTCPTLLIMNAPWLNKYSPAMAILHKNGMVVTDF